MLGGWSQKIYFTSKIIYGQMWQMVILWKKKKKRPKAQNKYERFRAFTRHDIIDYITQMKKDA